MNAALRRFLHNRDNIVTEGSPRPGICPTLTSNDFKGFYSAQYNRHNCTLQAFEQFGALYMNNHDDKYPARDSNLIPPELQAPVDTNEP